MSDEKFTKIAVGLLANVRNLVDWGIGGGHTSQEQLRLSVLARKEIAAELRAQGLSIRQIAAATGSPKSTIQDDVSGSGRKMSETGHDGHSKREKIREKNAKLAEASVEIPRDAFETIIIDPPWPMTKIERDVRPNQVEFDYPTMSDSQLRDFAGTVAGMAADDCHMFMWTTQKFLPLAMELIDLYGFRYVLAMVWHKPGGYQPTGLPQFNCEFVLYGRKGTPKFIDTKGFPCCFNAPRREHSRKPDEFYDIVGLVTKGPRIDVFSREAREGFAQYGNEADKFAGAA